MRARAKRCGHFRPLVDEVAGADKGHGHQARRQIFGQGHAKARFDDLIGIGRAQNAGVDGAVLKGQRHVGVADLHDVRRRRCVRSPRSSALASRYSPPLPGPPATPMVMPARSATSVTEPSSASSLRTISLVGLFSKGSRPPGAKTRKIEPLIPAVPERGDDGDAAHVDLSFAQEGDGFGAGLDRVDIDVQAILVKEPALRGHIQRCKLHDRHVGDA